VGYYRKGIGQLGRIYVRYERYGINRVWKVGYWGYKHDGVKYLGGVTFMFKARYVHGKYVEVMYI